MKELLTLAQESSDKYGEVPIAAAIIDPVSGEIVARSGNRVERDNDPTAHAEMLVIREAMKNRERSSSKFLSGYHLYVTLEPCAMCAQAISHARIDKVIFGAYDPKSGGVDHGARVFSHPQCHHKPEVVGGVSEQESAALLQRFFAARR